MRHHVRKGLVLVFGLTLLAIGIAMIVLPGPAFVVIPLSLVVLGTEFFWARRLLAGMRAKAHHLRLRVADHRKRLAEKRKAKKSRG